MGTATFKPPAGQRASRQAHELTKASRQQPEVVTIEPEQSSSRCSIEETTWTQRPFGALTLEVHGYKSGGFAACIDPLVRLASGRRLWIKGHGTGTLEAGRLEAEAFRRACPASPLVGWKGSLGHTLGSNGLVELAVALESLRSGRIPGTVGSAAPTFSEMVSLDPIADSSYDGVICASNAFGGAHAALLLCHA